MKTFQVIFITLFVAVLCLPLANTAFGIFPALDLGGVTAREAKYEPSWQSFLDGEMQPGAATKLLQASGMRPYFVRTANQINYSLLGQLNNDYHAGVVLGKNGNAFRHSELTNFNRLNLVPDEELARSAADLRTLQDALAGRGRHFLLMISANRLSLYPEIVPDSYVIPGMRKRPGNYERFLPHLEREGVNTLDAVAFLREQSRHRPERFFGSAGGHYNEFAACLVARELVRRLEDGLDKEMVEVSCDPSRIGSDKSSNVTELVRLANLWRFDFPVTANEIVPTYRVRRGAGAFTPSLFAEGTSFMWGIYVVLDRYKAFRDRDFFYYFNTRATPKTKSAGLIDQDKVQWSRHVMRHDIFLIEIYEGAVEEVGHGIVPRAITYLTGEQRQAPPAGRRPQRGRRAGR